LHHRSKKFSVTGHYIQNNVTELHNLSEVIYKFVLIDCLKVHLRVQQK
jgi:hypothetical protein